VHRQKYHKFSLKQWKCVTRNNPISLSFCFVRLVGATSSKKPKAPSFQIGSGWNLAGLFFK